MTAFHFRGAHAAAVFLLLALASPIHTVLAAEGAGALEEIIVTATKRSESLSDVPMSIGVVSGEAIDKFKIEDMRDLQSFVPNFTVQSTFGNWAVRIRGLGSGVTNLAFDSSVSIFNDGIYCGRSRCLETALLDAERIEVARGPQGALFGKSTIAGALSVISARPTDEFESYVRASYEFENDGPAISAMVSGPITDVLRGRLVGSYEETDGYVKNTLIDTDEPEMEKLAVRGMLEWDISENMLGTLKVEHFDREVNGRSNQLVSPGLFGGLTADSDAEFEKDSERRVSTGTSIEDFDDSDSTSIVLSLDTTIGENTLTAIAGYWELDYENYLDVDGVAENFLNTTLSEEYDQTSLELRWLSPTGRTIEYIVGGLYHTSDTTTRQYSPFGFFPPALAPVPVGMDRNFDRETDTFSVYGQLTWNINDAFRVIIDARYTEEDQDGIGTAFPVIFPDDINPVYEPTAFAQQPEYLFFEDRKDTHFDPSIRLQWNATEEIMLYAVYAEGSKPGGLKANDGALGPQLLEKNADPAWMNTYVGQPSITAAEMAAGVTLEEGNGVFDFEDEQAKNYEIGAKALFADGRASLNVAVFQMDFDNLQTSSYDGTRFIIQNAASAEISGIELEGVWQATDNLRLTGSLGYLDHEYKEFMGAQCIVIDEDGTQQDPSCVDGDEDLSGEKLERTPDWEANLAADWVSAITSNLLLELNLSMYYSDKYAIRQDFHPLGTQDSFTKWDARIGLASADDRWDIALIGRNLGDKHVLQHAYEIADSNFVSFSEGRTIRLQGTVRF